jgi:sugar O-acyltransferase (sialic acid O-acetyltransferase NeuD family)
MKNLIIIGAGGFGREVYSLALDCIANGSLLNIKGFLDSNPTALASYENYPPILNNEIEYKPQEEDVFIIALTSIVGKRNCYNEIISKGGEFISIIHPTAIIMQNITVGMGCIIGRNCYIGNDCEIGNFVTTNYGAVVGHDNKIGDFSHIGPRSFIGGSTKIENEVTIYAMATIINNVIVKKRSVVGAGSVVIKNVEECTSVLGNPAKVIYKIDKAV